MTKNSNSVYRNTAACRHLISQAFVVHTVRNECYWRALRELFAICVSGIYVGVLCVWQALEYGKWDDARSLYSASSHRESKGRMKKGFLCLCPLCSDKFTQGAFLIKISKRIHKELYKTIQHKNKSVFCPAFPTDLFHLLLFSGSIYLILYDTRTIKPMLEIRPVLNPYSVIDKKYPNLQISNWKPLSTTEHHWIIASNPAFLFSS